MRHLLLLTLIAVFQFFQSAHAEGGCPPGRYPQNGQGWQTCVPIPGAQSQQQEAPRPQWRDQWQAIATDTPLGILGMALHRSTSKEAEKAATADCYSKGGKECEVQISIRNGCIAMVVGESTKNVQGDAVKERAIGEATKQCQKSNNKCVVYYSACDFAASI